ncbi:hypothetical protein EG329_010098 [Mollisiaceae sp. DMI_Dod_QoI]|nr:hypothetical protein EG329_010098 [Helotiales sp. DMI_Dod_QoI]
MNLTSSPLALSNTLSPPSKRKATTFEDDNSENIDPVIFLSPKRSKCPDGTSKDTLVKPTNFFLTRAPPSPNDFSSLKPAITSPRRPILNARSPAPRLDTSLSKSTPLSAPAGRSPTRKRIGILNRRRTSSPFTRVDPPKFSAATPSTGLGFSIDAALSGTIPAYSARQPQVSVREPDLSSIPLLHQPEAKDSWFFDIHEDTEEELATNLMEHSTCTLDISSDEESRSRERDNRGKENVPPPDDISQTRTQLTSEGAEMSMHDIKARVRAVRRKREVEEGKIELDRAPLGDLAAEDFYAEGCDEKSVFLVPSDASEEHEEEGEELEQAEIPVSFNFSAELKGKGKEVDGGGDGDAMPRFDLDIDTLMSRNSFDVAPKAALLQPIEKPDEGFELWESGSQPETE